MLIKNNSQKNERKLLKYSNIQTKYFKGKNRIES